ncbi:MAG: tetratricopeptide repeat protein [Methylacidiphilales bacterium]|nr:tetratricopeptide repeat protein [Candidatus Methylacidiphilales bacterium]
MLHYFFDILNGGLGLGGMIFAVLVFAFTVWMFIHAIRNGEYIWAVFIFFFYGLSALLYFFLVYRPSAGSNPLAGFELPGAADRRQIKRLQADIHHLDKPHLHLQLGDIYFSQGNLDQAETSYRAAYARDPNDEDIRAHLGNCLARQGKPKEALPLLEAVCAQNPKHDYGYTLMTLAETQAATGQIEQALATWRQVLSLYGYPRARVQYAGLLIQKKDYAEARKNLQEVVQDAPYVTKFQRKREAVWFSRAKVMMRTIPE